MSVLQLDMFHDSWALSLESIFDREFAFLIMHRTREGFCQNNILSSTYPLQGVLIVSLIITWDINLEGLLS